MYAFTTDIVVLFILNTMSLFYGNFSRYNPNSLKISL